uniref:Uncharacterized protein n=1 Tax=Plectus sambesii TaxID=2011161 RepID=A0A914W5J7_9BILA
MEGLRAVVCRGKRSLLTAASSGHKSKPKATCSTVVLKCPLDNTPVVTKKEATTIAEWAKSGQVVHHRETVTDVSLFSTLSNRKNQQTPYPTIPFRRSQSAGSKGTQ